MTLQHTTRDIFIQLSDCLHQLSNEQYSSSLPVLSGNTIGKHVRHILEFFECLTSGIDLNLVDYDNRRRDLKLENDVQCALQLMLQLQNQLESVVLDKPIVMSFAGPDGSVTMINTGLYRELVYNIEHAIHHMAIIKIACKVELTSIILPDHFGVAYSTVQYQEQCAQ